MKTVAIIGCGKFIEGKEGWAIGHAHADGYLKSGHAVKLPGVEVSPENLRAFGEKYKLPDDQLFASTDALYASIIPDCVSICTWPALHHPNRGYLHRDFPHVGAWMPGHRRDSWNVPTMREGAARTLQALLQVAKSILRGEGTWRSPFFSTPATLRRW